MSWKTLPAQVKPIGIKGTFYGENYQQTIIIIYSNWNKIRQIFDYDIFFLI